MTDPRYTKLAQTLIHYSCELKAGEKLLIEAIDTPGPRGGSCSKRPPQEQ